MAEAAAEYEGSRWDSIIIVATHDLLTTSGALSLCFI